MNDMYQIEWLRRRFRQKKNIKFHFGDISLKFCRFLACNPKLTLSEKSHIGVKLDLYPVYGQENGRGLFRWPVYGF